MKKQDKNRLSKKDRRLIKKAMLKAAAKGCDEVYKIEMALNYLVGKTVVCPDRRATDKGKPHAETWGRVEARGL